jgi:uncharacterized protein YkwD
MKSKINFILGLILGAVIFGGTAAVASGIIANRTTSTVLINGVEVSVEAYNIDGSNYFKLRDIGQAVDFAITWDGNNNRILIDTSKRYVPEEQISVPAQTPEPEQPQTPAMTLDEMKAEIVRLTNEQRAQAGLPELAVLPVLMDTAQAKADDMRANDYYGHNSHTYGTPGDMIRAAIPQIRGCGENLAPWTKTPAEAFAGWVESTEHLKNIVNPRFTHIGIGIIEGANGGYWWVQQLVSL